MAVAWMGESAGGQLEAILESGSSEEEEEQEEEEEDEGHDGAAMVQQDPASQELGTEGEQLEELEQASQALLAELSALEVELEVERTCRQQAEVYAAQVKRENKELKRLSLAPLAPSKDLLEEPPEEDPEPTQHCGEQLHDLQQKISWLLEQRKDLTSQVQELQRHNQDLQDQLEQGQEEQQRLRAALATSQRALKSFKRVSQAVTQDYWQALEQLELEQDLRLHAEAFAHEMLLQKKEANRQSRILLQGAEPSTQLQAALQEVGRLSRALEETRLEQQQKVKELEEQLGKRQELEELEVARAALAAAEEEKLELRKRLREAEGRLGGLQEEVESLREKRAQDSAGTPEPAVPPPPPPLPPPAPAVPVDPLSAIRQRKGLASAQRSKAGAEDLKARAVQEMMERIRSGVVLRPLKERPPLGQGPGEQRRSAALELQGILGAMKRGSRRRSGRRSGRRDRDRDRDRGRERDGQLDAILQRRRRALDVPDPPRRDPRDGERSDPGDKDTGTAPPQCWPGSGDRVPFRARVTSGLPRTRPLSGATRP